MLYKILLSKQIDYKGISVYLKKNEILNSNYFSNELINYMKDNNYIIEINNETIENVNKIDIIENIENNIIDNSNEKNININGDTIVSPININKKKKKNGK